MFQLLQSWEKELDQKGKMATVLMDLSKTYDCLPYDLLIAELNAYGIERVRHFLIYDHLSHRKKRKIASSYSS